MHISDLISKLNSGEGFAAEGILDTIKQGADFAQKLIPIAKVVGGPAIGTAISAIEAVIDFAGNVRDAAGNAGIVFSTDNVDDINRIINTLAAENDKLSKLVDAT